MFGQSLLSAFGSAACTTDTNQLFPGTVQDTTVATYQFNSATTSIPSNTYPGTPTNITYAAGKFGNAAVFNGSSSWISIPSQVSPSNDNSDFNYSFWLSTPGFTSGSKWVIGETSATGPVRIGIRAGVSTNNYTFDFLRRYGGSYYGYAYSTEFTMLPSTFYHFSVNYYHSTKLWKLYFNGQEIYSTSTVTYTGAQTAISSVAIGRYGPGNAALHWNGSIDQFRIFNSALPQAAVTALYNETTTTATYPYVDYVGANPNSIAYYKMSDATDQLGNYNGTATNVNFNTEGKFGFAGAFNGSSSKITATGFNITGNRSVSFWVKMESSSSQITGILSTWNNGADYLEGFVVRGGVNNTNFVLAVGTTNHTIAALNTNWNHIAVIYDGTYYQVYFNGTQVLTNIAVQSGIEQLSNLQLGARHTPTDTQYFDGSIDQIRIYDSALSAANVTTLYNEIECPAVAVTNAFNTVLYTGDGSSSRSITGTGFAPDFTWTKKRGPSTANHLWQNTVNGAGTGSALYSAASSSAGTYDIYGYISSFDPDGVTYQAGSSASYPTDLINENGSTYVSWNWKAGGTAVSNTDGTITSQVSANPSAGMSIVKYTGNGIQGATIGTGLSSPCNMIIVKSLDTQTANNNWAIFHSSVGTSKYLDFTTAAAYTSAVFPTVSATTVALKNSQVVNTNAKNYIAYCFHSVAGYSKIGFYVGNGSTTGPEIYTGFKPAFIIMKKTNDTSNWYVHDNKRNGSSGNVDGILFPNLSNAEDTSYNYIDFTSTGFVLKFTNSDYNTIGDTYIYMAIAE